jgi:hypothetical protein
MSTYAQPVNQIAALKELYTGDHFMKDLVYRKNPFLALVPKDESPQGMAGKYIPVPLIYAPTQGRSATFSNAQSNQNPAQLKSFFVYRVSNYSLATITNELLEATVGDAGAFIDEGKLQVDAAIRSISNDLAFDLFRVGTGSRGVVGTFAQNGTTAAGTVIQLQDPQSVVNFEVNMVLTAGTSDGGVPSADTVTLTNINRSTGLMLGTASTGSLSGTWTSGAYLAVQGDVASGGSSGTGTDPQSTTTTGYFKVTGLAGWLPINGPTVGESFWGVDRTADSVRLAGVNFNAVNESLEEGFIDASTLAAREGGEPDMGFVSFNSWAALEKEVGAKVQYVQVKHDMADIAFKGITVNAPYGPITIIADRNCISKTSFLLEMDTFKFRSLGKAPHILTYGREGLEGIRVYNADALEVRVGFYGNLVCQAPGFSAVVQLSA